MNEYIDTTYWIAVAHLANWHKERINRFIINIIHENAMKWSEFFALNKNDWKELYPFLDKELNDLENTRKDLPRIAFIAEQLQNEGFQIIPINSQFYPKALKENLKIKDSPPILYIKGKKDLLQEEAVAIVGSRNAGNESLKFTDTITKKAVKEGRVIISGYARGVDRQALDSAIEANGKCIVVLPQGILTFQSGFNKYYEPIVDGQVLIVSTFPPKANWSVGLAMERNKYIYGLAREIYVAESDSKGGTWQGAMDGLKRGRKIYIRYPEAHEKNANMLLIEKGAIPVTIEGEIIDIQSHIIFSSYTSTQLKSVNEMELSYGNKNRDIEKEILELLKKGTFTAKQIIDELNLNWKSRKLTEFLKNCKNVQTVKGKPLKFTRNDVEYQKTLFNVGE